MSILDARWRWLRGSFKKQKKIGFFFVFHFLLFLKFLYRFVSSLSFLVVVVVVADGVVVGVVGVVVGGGCYRAAVDYDAPQPSAMRGRLCKGIGSYSEWLWWPGSGDEPINHIQSINKF